MRGRKAQHLTEGQGILIPSGSVHREAAAHPSRLGWIGFDYQTSLAASHLNRSITLGSSTSEIVHLLLSIYQEQSTRHPASTDICALALRHILLLFERAAQSKASRQTPSPLRARQVQVVQSLAAYLDQNVGQPFSLEQVAEYHHLSAAHLSLLFQKHYRVTPTAYRLQKRLAHARRLLQETPHTIKEIATACGFTDAAHFCKEFKKQTGRTPGQARPPKAA